jgi:hypothetical protein
MMHNFTLKHIGMSWEARLVGKYRATGMVFGGYQLIMHTPVPFCFEVRSDVDR